MRRYSISQRCRNLGIVFLCIAIVITCRLGYVMVVQGEELAVMAEENWIDNTEVISNGIRVKDVNGIDLLEYEELYRITINPYTYNQFNDDDAQAVRELTYTLRNYKPWTYDYDLDQVDKYEEYKIMYLVDEETYNEINEIEGIDDVAGVVRDIGYEPSADSWSIEGLLASSTLNDDQTRAYINISLRDYKNLNELNSDSKEVAKEFQSILDEAELYDIKILNDKNESDELEEKLEEAYKEVIEREGRFDDEIFSELVEEIFEEYRVSKLIEENKTFKVQYEVGYSTYVKINEIENIDEIYGVESEVKKTLNSDIALATQGNEAVMAAVYKNDNRTVEDYEVINNPLNVEVVSTIDKEMQDIVDEILQDPKYNEFFNNENDVPLANIGVTIMEADTGEIRVMAQEDYSKANINLGPEGFSPRAPGSIFKIIVASAALNEGIIEWDDLFTHVYTDEEGNEHERQINVIEALQISSNTAFEEIGNLVGEDTIYEYAEKIGLLSPVLNLEKEVGGRTDSNKEMFAIAIGQGIDITPVSALSIANLIATGGVHVEPSIVKGYSLNSEVSGYTYSQERILDKQVANIVEEGMKACVLEGTGTNAYVEGVNMAGKTGTAEDGEDKTDGWFVGYFDHEGTRYTVSVIVRDIESGYFGGGTAAVIFKDIVEALTQ